MQAVPKRETEAPESRGRRIAFIKSGTFSHTNESVRKQLVRLFPEFEVVTFEIRDILRAAPFLAIRNVPNMLATYGIRSLIRIADPVDCYIQTPVAFEFLKKRFAELIRPDEFAFTFQTQTLWDAAVPGIPHFLYTDQTNLTHRRNPGVGQELKMLPPWWDKLETRILKSATRVYTMSSHVTQSVIEDYECDPASVECVYVGNNAPVATGLSFELERYSRKRILFVGVDWDLKGGPELLAAFRAARATHPDARLTIIGCSPQLSEPGCEVIGRIPPAAVSDYYKESSLFCLPTKLEAFGIVYVEAMKHGLPVIGTDMGAIPDFIHNGENGFRIRMGDVPALSATLTDLLGKPAELQRMGQNSTRLASVYNWDDVGARLSASIRSVLGVSPPDRTTAQSHFGAEQHKAAIANLR